MLSGAKAEYFSDNNEEHATHKHKKTRLNTQITGAKTHGPFTRLETVLFPQFNNAHREIRYLFSELWHFQITNLVNELPQNLDLLVIKLVVELLVVELLSAELLVVELLVGELLVVKLWLTVENDASTSVLCPEQLRVLPPQLIVLGNLSRRHRQMSCLRLEAPLVGHIVDTVGDAVITDELVAALLLQTAGLGLRARGRAADLLRLGTHGGTIV